MPFKHVALCEGFTSSEYLLEPAASTQQLHLIDVWFPPARDGSSGCMQLFRSNAARVGVSGIGHDSSEVGDGARLATCWA